MNNRDMEVTGDSVQNGLKHYVGHATKGLKMNHSFRAMLQLVDNFPDANIEV
jgi:hypothetical protein